MDNNSNENGFSYTYSAKEQAEIKKIREKYAPKLEEVDDKMTRIRKLDASVNRTAQTVALTFGIIGTLILGFGMSLIMTELAEKLSLENYAMLIGVLVGIFGGVTASLAYPIYSLILKVKRKKIAPEIIRLSDELMR